MTLFSNQGLVVQLPTSSQLMGIYLEDIHDPFGLFNFSNRLAAITSIATDESASIQLRMMFNNKSYINVFGDNFGMMSVSGMFMSGQCDGQQNYSGFESIVSYFREHRASHLALSLTVAIGGMFKPVVYQAFLLDCKAGLSDPQYGLGQFALQLAYVVPDVPDDPVNGFTEGDFDNGGDFGGGGDFGDPGFVSPGDDGFLF